MAAVLRVQLYRKSLAILVAWQRAAPVAVLIA
jgi:hypothetical protein